MSILESIFNGEEYFLDNVKVRNQREYRVLSNKIDKMETDFLNRLSPEEVSQFENLCNLKTELSLIEKTEIFKAAVSYGIQLMGEVYNSDLFEF